MEGLILDGVGKMASLYWSFSISVGAGIALVFLLFLSEKDKFYPAMPFISAGCFAGFGVILLLV